MIRLLKYHEIDFEKYSLCIQNSVQNNFYAQKEILDFLTENSWELLVDGDYEAVMPIPVKRKWLIKFVYMPNFCQQLGVFSKEDSKLKDLQFLESLNKNYKIHGYYFNENNNLDSCLGSRKNYVIKATDYALLRKRYFKGRKSTVKSAQNFRKEQRHFDKEIKDFISNNFKGLANSDHLKNYLDYLNFLNQRNQLVIYTAINSNNEICNVALLIDTAKEVLLLGLINKEEFMKQNGASYLIDQLIQKYVANKDINMMGGTIRGIEVFFKSFGAGCEEYPFIYKSKIEFIKSFI